MAPSIVDRIVAASKKAYGRKARVVTLVLLAPIFLFLIPLGLYLGSRSLDATLRLPRLLPDPYQYILAIPLLIVGAWFSIWSIHAQHEIGKGTPIPVVATQKLIITRPFDLCRNPMSFGSLLLYCGFAVIFSSISALVLVVLFFIALLAYIKFLEEKELEARFGSDYLEYKSGTPFLVPWPRRGRRSSNAPDLEEK